MTIYFDISAAVHRRAGLGRYADSLARALLPLLGDELAFFYNREAGIEPLAGLEGVPAATVNLGYKPWRMLVWLGQVGRIGFNRLVPGATLFHATEHLLLPLRGAPTVLTVHDLIFRRYPAHHKRLNRWYLNATMPLFCRRAGHIIAVSEQSKRDVIEAYGIPPEKITVIYEAADPRFCPQPAETVAAVRARYGLPDRYLLFVGTIEPRKNLGRVLAAFERLHAEGLTDALVIVGKRGWLYDDFFARLEGIAGEAGRDLPRLRPRRRSARGLCRRAGVGLPQRVRGFWLARARGDGVRHAGGLLEHVEPAGSDRRRGAPR